MSVPMQLAGKVRAVKKSPVRHSKKKSEMEDYYNPNKKGHTALREVPRASKWLIVHIFRFKERFTPE